MTRGGARARRECRRREGPRGRCLGGGVVVVGGGRARGGAEAEAAREAASEPRRGRGLGGGRVRRTRRRTNTAAPGKEGDGAARGERGGAGEGRAGGAGGGAEARTAPRRAISANARAGDAVVTTMMTSARVGMGEGGATVSHNVRRGGQSRAFGAGPTTVRDPIRRRRQNRKNLSVHFITPRDAAPHVARRRPPRGLPRAGSPPPPRLPRLASSARRGRSPRGRLSCARRRRRPLAAVEDVVVPARGASLVRGAVSVPAALLGSLDALALPSHAAPSPAPVADLALSDAWFGWYFAPGGVVLGPALLLTAFLLGQALFEKITGTGPKKKK